jgi:hypothetical protein
LKGKLLLISASHTYYCIKSSIHCHCTTHARHTKCWSNNILGEFSPKIAIISHVNNRNWKGIENLERYEFILDGRKKLFFTNSSSNYHTNACCNPEYAIRGMVNSIRASNKRVIKDFDRETTVEYNPTEES